MKRLRFWIGLAISLVFLYLAFRGQDFGKIRDSLLRVNYAYLFPALVLYFIGVWVRTVRWHYLLRPTGRVTSRRLWPVVVIGYMANDVLPARMGEVVRAYVLGQREGLSKSGTFATIVVERMLDGVVMLLFILCVSVTISLGASLMWLARIATIVFAGGLTFFFVIASSREHANRVFGLLTRFLPHKVAEPLVRLLDSFIGGLQILRSGRALALAFLLSIVAWVFEAGMYLLIGWGFGAFPVSAAFLSTAVANLATLVPSSPGYVGTFESAIRLVLEPVFGFGPNLALSFAVVLHAALYFPITFWGFYYWWRESLSLKEIENTAAPAPDRLSTTSDGKA